MQVIKNLKAVLQLGFTYLSGLWSRQENGDCLWPTWPCYWSIESCILPTENVVRAWWGYMSVWFVMLCLLALHSWLRCILEKNLSFEVGHGLEMRRLSSLFYYWRASAVVYYRKIESEGTELYAIILLDISYMGLHKKGVFIINGILPTRQITEGLWLWVMENTEVNLAIQL